MKPSATILSLIFAGLSLSSFGGQVQPNSVRAEPGDPSFAFVENRGQWDSRAEFLATLPHLNFWLTQDGAVMDFHRAMPADGFSQPRVVVGDVVKASFVNAIAGSVRGKFEMPGYENFMLGSDPSKWVSGARRYSEVRAEQVYSGISVRYYFVSGSPRYDALLSPGADPSQLAMRFEGARGVRVTEAGNLEVETSLGLVEEKGLTAYQEIGVLRVPVKCRLVMSGEGVVRFQTGPYDKQLPLVIDPLIFSTFLGGTDGNIVQDGTGDAANAVALDNSNNVLVAGVTYSTNFPVTAGAYQRTNRAGFSAFITKVTADGGHLMWSTYLGGSGGAAAHGLKLDGASNALVTGSAGPNFPTTVGAYQSTIKSASTNAFVSKLTSDGKNLMWSTYIGGSGADTAYGIALNGQVPVVAGQAFSTDFPVTTGAYQAANRGAGQKVANAFVATLSADGAHLTASTYLGGTGRNGLGDNALAIALDTSGNAVIAGKASSSDFPVSVDAFQTTNKGNVNAFVARISADAKTLVSSTYIGGTLPVTPGTGDSANAVVLDSNENAVIAGDAYSTDFPTTPMAFQGKSRAVHGRQDNAFVSKITPDGKHLLASTYLGGFGDLSLGGDSAQALALDLKGDLLIAGSTWSINFPTTVGAYQTKKQVDGNFNVFVSKLTADCGALLYSTVMGGTKNFQFNAELWGDVANAIAVDSGGRVVIAGQSDCADYPVTAGAYQRTNFGEPENGSNAFVTKLSTDVVPTVRALSFVSQKVAGGDVGQGIVQLGATAQSNVGVSLSSADPSLAHVPVATFVALGNAKAVFNILTPSVTSQHTVLITATYKGTSASAALVVFPLEPLSITLQAPSLTGGASQNAYVTLNDRAPAAGEKVYLLATNAAAHVPSTITVPANMTKQTFKVATTPVAADAPLYVLARIGDVTRNAPMTVLTPKLVNAIPTAQNIQGGTTAGLEIYLDGPAPASGVVVQLQSEDPAFLTVPASVTVPAGLKVYTANVIATKPVWANNAATIKVTRNGVTISVTVTVTP